MYDNTFPGISTRSLPVKDFGQWFSEQGHAVEGRACEDDDTVYLTCSCGKWEAVSLAQLENGGTGWYVEGDLEPGDSASGKCGSNQWCLP